MVVAPLLNASKVDREIIDRNIDTIKALKVHIVSGCDDCGLVMKQAVDMTKINEAMVDQLERMKEINDELRKSVMHMEAFITLEADIRGINSTSREMTERYENFRARAANMTEDRLIEYAKDFRNAALEELG